MAKKPIEEKHEFIKFIKNLYTEEAQLNFDRYFKILSGTDKHEYSLIFPNNKFYIMDGSLNLTDCPSFDTWISSKENTTTTVSNPELDILRKVKLGDFVGIKTDDDKYTVEIDTDEFTMTREKTTEQLFDRSKFVISAEIPKEHFEEGHSMFIAYIDKDNNISYDPGENKTILFESPLKNFKVLFKKEVTYHIYATEPKNGFRVVMIEGAGQLLKLRQYFRVI